MRKTFTIACALATTWAIGQDGYSGDLKPVEYADKDVKANAQAYPEPYSNGTEAVLWSEDFGTGSFVTTNGTWVASGQNASLVKWDTVGPTNLLPFGWGPLPSPTASNGFALWDFYGNHATGFAADPMQGILTSPTIVLGAGDTSVVVEFYQQLYWCCEIDMDIWLEVSADGGTTWDQYKVNTFDRNVRHWNVGLGYKWRIDVSETVKQNPANVKLRFNWTGLTADQNGQYSSDYFWMIDDIAISEVPSHSIELTEYRGAPRRDIIFTNSEVKYGVNTLKQARSVSFDCNVYNFGTSAQTNLQLEVQVWDSNNTLVTTLNSATTTLNSKDTANYAVLNTTGTWTPMAEDTYTIVYIAKSDSVDNVIAPYATDTVTVYVVDSLMSPDFNVSHNGIGTVSLGDGSGIGVMLDMTNDERLFAADLVLHSSTMAGSSIEVRVYDTIGFDPISGFPTSPLTFYQHTVTAADVANGFIRADLTHPITGYPLYLSSTTAYYIIVNMFDNGGTADFALRNDQTFPQPGWSTIMYITNSSNPSNNNRWWGSFANSLTFNAPHIRAIMCPAGAAATCMKISIEEVTLNNKIKVGPNPATDYVFLNFEDVTGEVEYSVMDLQGRTILNGTENALPGTRVPVHLGELTPGVYMLHLTQGEAVSTFKLTVN